MVSSIPAQAEPQKRRGNDPISWYLQNIGRVPLLTPAEEIELGNQVQRMMILTEDGQLNEKIKEFTTQQKRTIKMHGNFLGQILRQLELDWVLFYLDLLLEVLR